jgi:hypothetical protein
VLTKKKQKTVGAKKQGGADNLLLKGCRLYLVGFAYYLFVSRRSRLTNKTK